MYFLIPLLASSYYFRYTLLEYILRSISKIEINYNKWYRIKYPTIGYDIYMNRKLLNKNEHIPIITSIYNNDTIFEIKYTYNNKIYSIFGNKIDKLLDYVENVNSIIELEHQKKTKNYKWISAIDNNNVCYLDIIKRVSGPLGDFYNHTDIDINSDYILDITENNILLTNYNLDEYTIKPSTVIRL